MPVKLLMKFARDFHTGPQNPKFFINENISIPLHVLSLSQPKIKEETMPQKCPHSSFPPQIMP